MKNKEITVESCQKSGMVKCPRCWHYHYGSLNFGHEPGHEKYGKEFLCNNCIEIILNNYPDHPSVKFILENLEQRGLKREDNPISANEGVR